MRVEPVSMPYGGASGDARRLWLAGALGAVCAAASLQAWWLGPSMLLGLLSIVWGLQRPVLCWKLLLLQVMFLANFMSGNLNLLISWGCVTLFMAAAWLELGRQPRMGSGIGSTFWWCAAVWLAWACVSAWYAPDKNQAIREVSRYMLSFAVLLTYVNWLRSGSQIAAMWRWWNGVALFLAILAMVKMTVELAAGREIHLLSLYPPQNNEFGMVFAALLPLHVATMYVSTDRAERRRTLWRMAVLSSALFVYSGSQAAWLSCAVGSLAVCWMMRPAWRRPILLAGLVGTAAVLLGLKAVVGSVLGGVQYCLSGRHLVWGAAMEAIGQHPITGIGPGCWSVWFGKHFLSVDFILHDLHGNWFFLTPSELGGEAHNLFLTKAAEMGIPSLVVLLGLFWIWHRAAYRTVSELSGTWARAVSVGCLSSLYGMLAHTIFENGPIIGRGRGADMVVVWLLAALPFALAKIERMEGGSGGANGVDVDEANVDRKSQKRGSECGG